MQRSPGRISAVTAPITAPRAKETTGVNEPGRLLDGFHHLYGHSVSAQHMGALQPENVPVLYIPEINCSQMEHGTWLQT